MAVPNPEKGARYIGLLDKALCNADWTEVPELARKTDKHAPERRCLSLTARTEAQVAAKASDRPSTAYSTAAARVPLLEVIPKLEEAAQAESRFPEDAFVARVCISEIYWLHEDWDKALNTLPQTNVPSKEQAKSSVTLGWVEVSQIRALVIRAAVAERKGQVDEARNIYLSASQEAPGSRSLQLRLWTERLLGRGSMFTYRIASDPSIRKLSDAVRCFTAWSDFWQRVPATDSGNIRASSRLDIPRRTVWKSYYDLLSTILQHGLMSKPNPSDPSDILIPISESNSDEQSLKSKLSQHSVFKKVEATYESLLLKETQFPTAEKNNTEIEQWIEQVVDNWRTICGAQWAHAALGETGLQSHSRGVLDILYRGATKTFHSTSILRHLFNVHSALGEFDLAMRAFDSYVELFDREKARAEKTGEHDLDHATIAAAVLTGAQAIRLLCRYGDFEQAKRSIGIGDKIQDWIQGRFPVDDVVITGNAEDDGSRQPNGRVDVCHRTSLSPMSLASAYTARGIALAQWARSTYESHRRRSLHVEAIHSLRQAHQYDPGRLETSYALALILAETSDVDGAIEVATQAIDSAESKGKIESNASKDSHNRPVLSSILHLLTLCLTAKGHYERAGKTCETALLYCDNQSQLYGTQYDTANDHDEKQINNSHHDLAHYMEGMDKEVFLQIKITQLALVEFTEGPDAALEMSHALFSLYVKFFGNLKPGKPLANRPKTATTSTLERPGTLRSLAGSIRPKSKRNSIEKDSLQRTSISSPPPTADDTTTGENPLGVPIAITVTNEDGLATEKHHHHHLQLPFKLRGSTGDWRQMNSFKSKSTESFQKRFTTDASAPPVPALPTNDFKKSRPMTAEHTGNGTLSTENNLKQPLKSIEHNAPHDAWPPPAGHENQPPEQDVRLPAPHPAYSWPEPNLPSAQQQQHKITVLVALWLFIGGVYVRADLFEEAHEAFEEAGKVVESFESEVSAENSQARHLYAKGWGAGKSVDALWADVLVAKAELAVSRNLPFKAMENYDRALSYYPDHCEGIIGVSNILLDIYEEKVPVEEPKLDLPLPTFPTSTILTKRAEPNAPSIGGPEISVLDSRSSKPRTDPELIHLNRLAARDRAYMLLSNITRQGSSWNNSDAWCLLARAHELSKQIREAKEALWWVVELEETRPLRSWRDLGAGGYTL